MESYTTAYELPPEWDILCGENFALKRDFLCFMEGANPCGQRYYGFRDARGRLDSIMMTLVQERFNLTMFTPFTLPIRVTIVYVPLSASTPGMVCGQATRAEVFDFLADLRGFTLVLNLPPDYELPDFAQALTCPRIRLCLRWTSFEDYLHDLRSSYRRRYRIAMRKAAPLIFRQLDDPRDFTAQHYALYEQVFNKSRIRVEKLTLDYFRGCDAKILLYEKDGVPVGFMQLIENGEELVFGFVGVDYAVNETYDVYHNLLLRMVDHGIRGGFTSIDLGQTADDTKLKLGGEYEMLYAHLHHHNPLLNGLLKRVLPYIGYQPIRQPFHVFKSSASDSAVLIQPGGTGEHTPRSTQTA